MNQIDRNPTFNMKVVVHETGLKPDTLRAWERRYGMPNPHRTDGGHRLYSQYEIDILKWMVARQEEGLSISHAVELWQQITARGEDPLDVHPLHDTEQTTFDAPVSGDMLIQMRDGWLKACLDFDEQSAQRILAQAFAIFPLETVCFEILQKGLTEIGAGWYAGKISVQQEHFTSALAVRQLEALLTAMPKPSRNGRVLVACPPKEQHTFSPLLLTVLLRRRGWDVTYLGANVPLSQLDTAVKAIQPQLIVTSAQTLTTAGTTRELALQMLEAAVPLAYGGGIFNALPELRAHIPAYFLGSDFLAAVRTIEKFLQTPPDLPVAPEVDPQYKNALAHYRNHRATVEAAVLARSAILPIAPQTLAVINEEFGNSIIAALSLEEIDLLDVNRRWINGLLQNYNQPEPLESLRTYFRVYNEAAEKHLDQRAAPLLAWLAGVT